MTRPGSAIVTDPLNISDVSTTRLVRIEAFSLTPEFCAAFEAAVGVAPPAACRTADGAAGVVLWAEAKAWLADGDASALEAALGDHAAVSDVSGAWRRIDVTGEGWRTLMTIEGLLDVENPAFGPGCIAATVQHHAPVMLHVVTATHLAVYTAPSFAHHLHHALTTAARRLAA